MSSLNLARILKGHEGEIFYNPLLGDIKLSYIYADYIVFTYDLDSSELFVKHNGNSKDTDEPAVFPSKEQRNWKVWDIETNYQGPKTWSELIKVNAVFNESAGICSNRGKDESKTFLGTPLEKSALALLKIYKLIEKSYGGLVTKEYRNIKSCMVYGIAYDFQENEFLILPDNIISHSLVTFYTEQLAEEFLSHPENVELLKDLIQI